MQYVTRPEIRSGTLSGSESGWSVPRRKGKVPVVEQDTENNHDLSKYCGYGNTWQIRGLCESPVIQSQSIQQCMRKMAIENGWEIKTWKI